MNIPIYQVDAFAEKVFQGNYAAVCLLKYWPTDKILLDIAVENNLSETAYITQEGQGFRLRWFTPDGEIDLCGHATLASAHVLFEHLRYTKERINFLTRSGPLYAIKKDGIIFIDLPSRPGERKSIEQYEELIAATGLNPKEVYLARDLMLVCESEQEVEQLQLDASIMAHFSSQVKHVIVTARGSKSDFVSRFFSLGATHFEDPVTGSAHCTLIPYWSSILGKKKLFARQLSARGGSLQCEYLDDRIWLGGHYITYMEGEIFV